MITITPKLKLHRPEGTDKATRELFNANLDAIELNAASQEEVESHWADYVRQPGYATTTGTSTAYTANLTLAPTAYVEGFGITIVPHVDCGASPTLNVNDLGTIQLLTNDGFALSAKDLLVGKPYSFRKVGASFFLDSAGGVKVPGQKEVLANYTGSITKGDPVYIKLALTKLANADVLPTIPQVMGNTIACSSDGVYLAVGTGDTYISFYKRVGDVLTKLANPTSMPINWISNLAMSSDGVYVIGVTASSPYVYFYKRTGDVWTKLANPTTLPTSGPRSVAMSPDGLYAIAQCNGGGVTYKRSGDIWAEVVGSINYSNSYAIAFAPDGLSYAVGISGTLYLAVRSGDIYSSNGAPVGPGGNIKALCFSADSNYLAIQTDSVGVPLTIYKRSGNTLTKLIGNINIQPGTGGMDIKFSHDGKYLYVTSSTFAIYRISGERLTKVDGPSLPPPNSAIGLCGSDDNKYVYVSSTATPYLTLYKTSLEASLSDGMIGQLAASSSAGYALATGATGTINRVMSIFN